MSAEQLLYECRLEFHPAIPILQKHLDFLVERHEHFVEAGGRPDALGEMFSPEWLHESMSKVVAQGAGHLTKASDHHGWMKRRLSS